MTDTAFNALQRYIDNSFDVDAPLDQAQKAAGEFGLAIPDAATGSLLSTLAVLAAGGQKPSLIAVAPAAGVVGLHLLRGLGGHAHLTCIDPESEHQRNAREALQAGGYRSSSFRVLPSRPLEVMGRLAAGSYHLIYADVRPTDTAALTELAWPLLKPGGVLVLADSLLDGTIGDEERTDRDTVAAREADQKLQEIPDAVVSRLPLGAGLTLVTKKHAD